jgi:hypothetical protein
MMMTMEDQCGGDKPRLQPVVRQDDPPYWTNFSPPFGIIRDVLAKQTELSEQCMTLLTNLQAGRRVGHNL